MRLLFIASSNLSDKHVFLLCDSTAYKKICFNSVVLFQYIFLGLGKHCPLLGASKNVPQTKNVKINTRFSLSITGHTIGLNEESLAGEQN